MGLKGPDIPAQGKPWVRAEEFEGLKGRHTENNRIKMRPLLGGPGSASVTSP